MKYVVAAVGITLILAIGAYAILCKTGVFSSAENHANDEPKVVEEDYNEKSNQSKRKMILEKLSNQLWKSSRMNRKRHLIR